MNRATDPSLSGLILQSQPTLLLYGVLLYGLGGAIARYLGFVIRPWPYLAGQLGVLSLQVGAHYLSAFYSPSGSGLAGGAGSDPGGEADERASVPSRWMLYLAMAAFSVAAVIASLLLASGSLPPVAAVLGAAGALAAVAYAVPPLRLETRGYGELSATVSTALLIPAFAFGLLTGETHRLLPLTTTPLACFTFAALIANQLPDYTHDLARNRRRLMVRLGWRRAMRIHDGAVILGLALQIGLLLVGFPRRVAWGGLLGVPLAAALLWYLLRIRQGAPPRWTLLRVSSQGLAGLMAYLSLMGYVLS